MRERGKSEKKGGEEKKEDGKKSKNKRDRRDKRSKIMIDVVENNERKGIVEKKRKEKGNERIVKRDKERKKREGEKIRKYKGKSEREKGKKNVGEEENGGILKWRVKMRKGGKDSKKEERKRDNSMWDEIECSSLGKKYSMEKEIKRDWKGDMGKEDRKDKKGMEESWERKI